MEKVRVRRQWYDYRTIDVENARFFDFLVSEISGGVQAPSPYPMLYAYMLCSDIPEGEEFVHSCRHGKDPHRIKVCITQVHKVQH